LEAIAQLFQQLITPVRDELASMHRAQDNIDGVLEEHRRGLERIAAEEPGSRTARRASSYGGAQRPAPPPPKATMAIEEFKPKELNVSSTSGRGPDHAQLTAFRQHADEYTARTHVPVEVSHHLSNKLKQLLTATFNATCPSVAHIFRLESDDLYDYLFKLGAPQDVEEARHLLRSVAKTFGLSADFVLQPSTWPGFYAAWLVYASTFARVYMTIKGNAPPHAVPPLKAAVKPHEQNLSVIFLDPLKEVAGALHAELTEEVAKYLKANQLAEAAEVFEMIGDRMRAMDTHRQQPDAQRFARITNSAKIQALRLQMMRTPFRVEYEPSGGNDVADRLSGRSEGQKQDETYETSDYYGDEPDGDDPDGDDPDDQLMGLGKDDRLDSESEPHESSMKLAVLAFQAIGAATKPTSELPCFSWFNTGKCPKTTCEYSHKDSDMRQRWNDEFEKLRGSRWNPRPAAGGAAPQGPQRGKPAGTGPQGNYGNPRQAPPYMLRRPPTGGN
jgi:hypothetical protein